MSYTEKDERKVAEKNKRQVFLPKGVPPTRELSEALSLMNRSARRLFLKRNREALRHPKQT